MFLLLTLNKEMLTWKASEQRLRMSIKRYLSKGLTKMCPKLTFKALEKLVLNVTLVISMSII